MTKYARIDGGKVAELLETDGDITKMFHPDLVWVDCTANSSVAAGWSYSGGTFSAPSGPSLADQKAAKIVAIDAQLADIDAKSNRGSREIALAVAGGESSSSIALSPAAVKLAAYDAQAATLRTKRSAALAATTQAALDAVSI